MASHPLHYSSAAEPFDYRILESTVRALLPTARNGSRLLDIGCGNGFWAMQFARLGYSVVGIDPSATGVEQARMVCPNGRFEVREIGEDVLERLGEEPFDCVASLEVVEHLGLVKK